MRLTFSKKWHNVFRAIFMATLTPLALSGAAADEWHEMAKGCETVILEQSFAPFSDLEPAPFAIGKPGEKQFAVYSTSRELAAIARVVGDGEWDQCLVRESEEDFLRARTLAVAWIEGLAVAFPQSEYIWVNALGTYYVNPGMLRCDSEKLALTVRGFYGWEYVYKDDRRVIGTSIGSSVFRVFVTKETSVRADELCRERGEG